MGIATKVRSGEDRCPRCQWNARGGGLGLAPPHTCTTYLTPGQLATRKRQRELDRINQRTRR